jgi:hypothetical protein
MRGNEASGRDKVARESKKGRGTSKHRGRIKPGQSVRGRAGAMRLACWLFCYAVSGVYSVHKLSGTKPTFRVTVLYSHAMHLGHCAHMMTGARYANGGETKMQLCISAPGAVVTMCVQAGANGVGCEGWWRPRLRDEMCRARQGHVKVVKALRRATKTFKP